MADADAIVIGAGPNGLVAANLLADAGWDVLVLEAKSEPGGAVKTAELTKPGFGHDVCSAFYPLAAASPVLKELHLEEHGLVWRHAPLVLAHPTPDGRCAALSRDIDETAASLDTYAPGDGDAWRTLYGLWDRVGGFTEALLRPFPPVGPALRILKALRPSEVVPTARLALLPVRRLADETFTGAGGGLILAGNALHADLTPEAPGSGLFGLILAALGQQVGFPVPEGGAGRLADALVNRLHATGRAEVRCDTPVVGISVVGNDATAVLTAAGDTVTARKAVLADVVAPTLYENLLPSNAIPARTLHDLNRFEFDSGTVKVDWALDGDAPWTHPDARRAGTLHLADNMDQLTDVAASLAKKELPPKPFVLVGQMHVADPTRRPTMWAYTHIPSRYQFDDEDSLTRFADAMEDVIEAHAPGFRKTVLARHVMGPADLEHRNPNLVGGAINGGTAQLYQQLIFRPGPTTPVRNVFLASSSAHPGGGVHGAPGANAAIAALSRTRPWRAVAARLR